MSSILDEARRKRLEAEKVRATIPSTGGFRRGAVIEALRRLGVDRGSFSGEAVEGDAFFVKQSLLDLQSLLWDHWYLRALGGESYNTEPPDVPDVPEPEIKPSSCRCNCGYTCDRKCGLDNIIECIEKHYRKDCDHVWDGPVEEGEGWGSVTCSGCGTTRVGHDMWAGP